MDSIPSLIHAARPDGYFDYFNQRWLDYAGLPIEDLLGWKWTAAIHPEDVESLVAKLRFSIASGEPFLHEARVRRADGEYRWMLHHTVAVRDEADKIVKTSMFEEIVGTSFRRRPARSGRFVFVWPP